MTLKDCTKGELIHVIEQLGRYTGKYYVELALSDVERERERRKNKEAKRLLAIMDKKSKEIEHLYAPYNSDPHCQIPEGVVAKARAVAHEYDKAQLKWRKLMGIKIKK